jgi:predicted glycogen debranching enzyme
MTSAPQRIVPLDRAHGPGTDAPIEWLVTNGLGGYASGLVDAGIARRYHALLVAALPAPLGRTVALDLLRLSYLGADGERTIEHEDATVDAPRRCALREFRLDAGLPVWRFAGDDVEIEKRVVMPHRQNTTVVTVRLQRAADPVRLRMRPFVHVREHDAPLTREWSPPEACREVRDARGRPAVELRVSDRWPHVRWIADGAPAVWHLDAAAAETVDLTYETERRRGYDWAARLWSPGWVDIELVEGGQAAFIASTELWDTVQPVTSADALADEEARRRDLLDAAGAPADPVVAELTLAADQFLVVPTGRAEEVARERAAGGEPRTVIAGYHWFTDWGRDTMIGLEGLTLCTGRAREAAGILRTFGHHVRNGLIPNLFPEGEREGLYHTSDATLWFFHAIDRYTAVTGDRSVRDDLLPRLMEIVECHVAGTKFGIGVDPEDGLLTQGAPGYQLTWMDAKVGDWVVTPRRGKAVEINALWHNALTLMAGWLDDSGRHTVAEVCRAGAARARVAFNERFWNPATGGLFDVVDGEAGNDAACRPNQIFAVSLPHAPLARARWSSVVDVVRRQLLTPVGLRTLAPDHPQYSRSYSGDLRARDGAYHQGTVWAWLIGAFVDAWLKVDPDRRREARRLLEPLVPQLAQAGTGSISEIFDAEPPYTPRGCVAQAWSVAELLRAWLKTSDNAITRQRDNATTRQRDNAITR